MNFFKEIMQKPWLSSDAAILDVSVDKALMNTQIRWPEKTALYFFLAVVTVLFFLFTITFLSRSQASDFQALSGEPWLPLSDSIPLWENTFFLLLASISLQLSTMFNAIQRINVLLLLITLSSIFTSIFIFGQISVWQQLMTDGYFIATNPANSFFYLLTGLHGVHLIGGVLALLYVIKGFYKDVQPKTLKASLSLCTTYWHYLFLLWLFLFALLTATTETYRTIALICGF